MNPNDPNVLLLETVARHLDNDLLREVVFIGGAVAGLLITDSAARANGVSLQAGVVAAADERAKLERLCRTITRPAVSTERVSLTAQGLIHYRLKTPYRDGTTPVVFEPLDFIARLAALVPNPRVNLTRYHGAIDMNWRTQPSSARTGDTAARSTSSGARGGATRSSPRVDDRGATPAAGVQD